MIKRIASLSTVACAVLLMPLAANSAPSLAGTWMPTGDLSAIKTADGKAPPLNAEARRKYNAAIAARKAGKTTDPVAQCLPHGLPRLMFAPYPFEVLEEPTQITFVHEAEHLARFVYLNENLPPRDELDISWMGKSVGHWDGDTLVIDSAGFNDETTIDRAGMPHSEDMVLQERMTLKDGGNTLENEITITDPKTFTRPWKTRVTYKKMDPSYWLQQYVCTDKNPEA